MEQQEIIVNNKPVHIKTIRKEAQSSGKQNLQYLMPLDSIFQQNVQNRVESDVPDLPDACENQYIDSFEDENQSNFAQNKNSDSKKYDNYDELSSFNDQDSNLKCDIAHKQ